MIKKVEILLYFSPPMRYNLIFGKKTAQSLKNKALCRSVYIGYTALFFKLKKFF